MVFFHFFFRECACSVVHTNVLHDTSCWNQRGTRKHTVFNWIQSGGKHWVCFKLADFWCPDFAILATFTVIKKPKHCEYIMNLGVTTIKYNNGTWLLSKRIRRVLCTQSSSKRISLNYFFLIICTILVMR